MKRIFAILIVTVSASCGGTCPCIDETILPAFIGYSASDLDTVIIKRFAKGSNFSQQLDSFAYTAATVVYSQGGDTTSIVIMNGNQRFTGDSDWQVIIPADNRTAKITEITIKKSEQHCGGLFGWDKQLCVSPVESYKKDGVITTFKPNSFGNAIYIKK